MTSEGVTKALASAGTGFWSWDLATGKVVWDRGVETLFGLAPGTFEGSFDSWTGRIHPDDLAPVLETLEKAVETEDSILFDHRCIWPDGSVHWLECRGGVLTDENGRVTGAAGIAIDIDYRRLTEEERRHLLESERAVRRSLEAAWERLAQLHVIAVSLAGAASVREVAWVMVNQGTTVLGADGGFFSIVDRNRGRLVLQAKKGASAAVADEYANVPLDRATPAAAVARGAEPIYVTSAEEREARFPGLPAEGAAAFVIHPVAVKGEVVAVLAYGYVEAHQFTPDEREVIATIVEMSTQAIHRASLHDATETAATRSTQLESVIGRLAGASTRQQIADIVVESLLPAVGAHKGSLYLMDEDSRSLEALAIHGYSPQATEAARILPLDGDNGPADAIRTRGAVYIHGPEEFTARYPELSAAFDTAEIAAGTAVFPLIVEREPIGTIGLGFDERHSLNDDERRHLAIVAGICAQALGRALAFEEANAATARLRSIDQITDAALSRLSLHDLFEELPARIAAAIGCDAVRLTLIDESGEYLEVRGSHGIPRERLARVPVGRGLSGTIAALGTPRVIEDISKVEVVGPPFPDHVTSEAGVPLRSGGRVIGVLDVGSGPQRPLTQADVELLEIAAERVATAIERSRAYEIERTERSRSELVGRVGEIINQAGPLPEQLEELAGLFCADLADCCFLTVLSDVNDALQACAHRLPQLQAKVREAAQRIYHDPRSGTAARSQIIDPRDMTAGADGDRQLRDFAEELELVSVLTAQLRGVSGPVGRIVLGRTAASPRFEADEVHLMDDVAGRMGTAIASRLTFERHRDTAITLQRSLLPSKLPAIGGLEVAARYWPASVSFEVGGDFYDVIELEPDRWGIIVGDVSGKGVEAAAMTGIARHTARAAARHGIGPAGVLQWVHEAFLEQAESTETYCTAVFGLLDRLPDRFVFRFAIGGHPLPILRPAGGAAAFVGRPGTVLGLIDPIELVETEVVLEREDSLFIYTDGVTDVPVANAITDEELIEIVEESSALSAADSISSLDEVLRSRYGHYENRDDTAVLVMKHSTAESGDLRGHLTRSGIEN